MSLIGIRILRESLINNKCRRSCRRICKRPVLFVPAFNLIQVTAPVKGMNEHNHSDFNLEEMWDLDEDNEENFDSSVMKSPARLYSIVSRGESRQVMDAVLKVDEEAFINSIKTEQVWGYFYQKPTE